MRLLFLNLHHIWERGRANRTFDIINTSSAVYQRLVLSSRLNCNLLCCGPNFEISHRRRQSKSLREVSLSLVVLLSPSSSLPLNASKWMMVASEQRTNDFSLLCNREFSRVYTLSLTGRQESFLRSFSQFSFLWKNTRWSELRATLQMTLLQYYYKDPFSTVSARGAIQSQSDPGVTSGVRRDGGEIDFLLV